MTTLKGKRTVVNDRQKTIFSLNLRKLMDEKELTYAELGRRIGVSSGSITYYLNGKFLPSAVTLKKLAELANMDYKDVNKLWTHRLNGFKYRKPVFQEMIVTDRKVNETTKQKSDITLPIVEDKPEPSLVLSEVYKVLCEVDPDDYFNLISSVDQHRNMMDPKMNNIQRWGIYKYFGRKLNQKV